MALVLTFVSDVRIERIMLFLRTFSIRIGALPGPQEGTFGAFVLERIFRIGSY